MVDLDWDVMMYQGRI